LRRARLLLALRYYGAAGTAAALIVAAAATIILLAGQLTPTPNFWIVMGASAAGTVLVLGLASSHELNRRLGEWKRELEAVTDELEMHRDTIRVLNRRLREVRRCSLRAFFPWRSPYFSPPAAPQWTPCAPKTGRI